MKIGIGHRLKELRQEKGLTQKELAAMVKEGIDYTYIGKIERGEQLPSMKLLLSLSEALSVPAAYFVMDEKEAVASTLSNFGLDRFTHDTEGRRLLKSLSLLNDEEIPFVTEIIHVLRKFREKTTVRYELSDELQMMAAEKSSPYRAKKKKKKSP